MATEKITLNFKGVDLDIEFYYQPEEKEFFNYKEGYGHPGCAESADITDIKHKGECFWELMEDYKEELEQIILNIEKEY